MNLKPLFPRNEILGICTDLYELAMAAAYFQAGRTHQRATFELFTRALPKSRSFLIAAGLEQALHYLFNIRFSEESLRYLRQLELFGQVPEAFFDYLKDFRFTGEVRGLPEGTIFFANEPLLEVSGPIIEAQIVETFLINSLNFQSMVASKAARVCLAAKGKRVVDFGTRRAHSPQAGILAARAAFIGGCSGTSNVWAGFEMGIPVYGTMAHSFVQSFRDEAESFRRFLETFPQDSILLVDTYDTLEGVRKAIREGGKMAAVRLDSGNLAELAPQVRSLLDRHGRQDVQIMASGGLNEEKLHALALREAPIDGFGVGTDLVVSSDAPSCDLVYKLVEVVWEDRVYPTAKTSPGKVSVPHRKQIFRRLQDGRFAGDLVARWDESPQGDFAQAQPQLHPCVKGGQLTRELPDLTDIRERAARQLSRLPRSYKLLHTVEEYPVSYSGRLRSGGESPLTDPAAK